MGQTWQDLESDQTDRAAVTEVDMIDPGKIGNKNESQGQRVPHKESVLTLQSMRNHVSPERPIQYV
jgi:hypothetical protein